VTPRGEEGHFREMEEWKAGGCGGGIVTKRSELFTADVVMATADIIGLGA
jgi:hypothetical protein